MTAAARAGILSIGTYLPPDIRGNDWWPEDAVRGWKNRAVWDPQRADRALADLPGGGPRLAMAAVAEYADDPFHGSRERRVMPEGMMAADMEVEACRQAIERAGIRADQIDVLLGFTLIPDYINAPNACIVHDRLGLPSRCFTMNADAVCNSFQMQLCIAEQMIAGGRARHALLVQSSAIWRVNPPEESFSIHFGDGATAEVVGPVSSDRGLLAQAHRTDGSEHRALVCSVPGKNWWEDGRVRSMSLDREASRGMFLKLADRGRDVLGECFERTGHTAEEVDFFAAHQATVWFRRVAQEHIGLRNAKTLDTYPSAGTLSGANLPLVLSTAVARGLLEDGNLVAMYQGGTGATYSGTLLRWGR